MGGRRPPIRVRELSEEERGQLEVGLRSSDAFVVRRCRILLASDRGEWAPRIAEMLGCNDQTVRNVAEVSFAEGITAERVSDETLRQAIGRLGVRWKRAKQWITSPDPEYARKNVRATA